MTNITIDQPQTLSPEDRQAAADLLDDAYKEGDPAQIEAAHRYIDELQNIGAVATSDDSEPKITRLPSSRAGKNTPPHLFGGSRRILVTSGRTDHGQGKPKGWRSPEAR